VLRWKYLKPPPHGRDFYFGLSCHPVRTCSWKQRNLQATPGEDAEAFMRAAVQWFVECVRPWNCYNYL
jgi:hypothetical protein